MGTVLPLPAATGEGQVGFDRFELNRIVDLYGRMVAAGLWRDYAIEFRPDAAGFWAFRAAAERPCEVAEEVPRRSSLDEDRHRPRADLLRAEPRDLGIAQALRERVAQLTGVYGMDSREMVRDYEVVVHVLHCEGEAVDGRGTVRFAAEVDLIKPGAKEVVAHRAFTAAPAAWDGHDYAALAQALSGAVSELAEAIVAAVPGK